MTVKSIVVAMAVALCLGVGSEAWAHGGEDHDASPSPQVQIGAAPRAMAQTDAFELLVVFERPDPATAPLLTLYIDRYATNQPVAGATVELESGTFKALAKPVSAGVYSVPGEFFARPGRYPFSVSIQTTDSADLLDATLVQPAPDALLAPGAGTAPPPWRVWIGGAVLALVLGGLAVILFRRRAGRTSLKVEQA